MEYPVEWVILALIATGVGAVVRRIFVYARNGEEAADKAEQAAHMNGHRGIIYFYKIFRGR